MPAAENVVLVTYTLFPDVYPKTKIVREDVPWTDLTARIKSAAIYIEKAHCPLISMADYGDEIDRDQKCLRYAANVRRIFGVEIDYDGEVMGIDEAQRLLQAANLTSIIYTSPSHKPEKPRWRVLLPLGEPEVPEKRAEYVARGNKVLGGIASRESFTLSQSFYIGRVRGAQYEVRETTGRLIDTAFDIEPLFHTGIGVNGKAERDPATEEELRQAFVQGEGRYNAMMKLSARWAAKGMEGDDIEAALIALLGNSTRNGDGIDLAQRAGELARSAVRKYGNSRSPMPIRGTPQGAPLAGEPPPIIPPLHTEILDSDIANTLRLAARFGADLRFTVARGWFAWDGKRWATDEKAVRIQAMAKFTAKSIFAEIESAPDRARMFKHAKSSQSKKAIEAMIMLMRSEPGILVKITDFDANSWLLNVGNGTIDLRTGAIRGYSREDLISNIVDISFDPAATCELWDEFLWRVIDRNEDLYHYLRRFVGYLMVGDTSDQSLHFLYGLGANGKSVFCEVLMRLMGQYAIAVSPDMIMLKRHGGIPNDIARLRGVRCALMNETSQGARFDEAKLKDLTGSDTLNARFLHQEFFDFKPTHRIIIRGNHKPVINGTDDGIWRRLRLIPFSVTIPEIERDPKLLEKLESELPGILNWAIQGCMEWQESGLKPPPLVAEAVQAYREESDVLGRFITECCEKRGQIKSSVLFKSYQQYAESAGERWMPSKDFAHEMQRRGFRSKRMKSGVIIEGIELHTQETSREW